MAATKNAGLVLYLQTLGKLWSPLGLSFLI